MYMRKIQQVHKYSQVVHNTLTLNPLLLAISVISIEIRSTCRKLKGIKEFQKGEVQLFHDIGRNNLWPKWGSKPCQPGNDGQVSEVNNPLSVVRSKTQRKTPPKTKTLLITHCDIPVMDVYFNSILDRLVTQDIKTGL